MSELSKALANYIEQKIRSRNLRPEHGKVKSVDEDARTCEVEPDQGPPVVARMQAAEGGSKGLFIKPVKGSSVILSFLDDDVAYVALTFEIEKILLECEDIELNGGNNGELAIYKELKKELNKEKARVDTIIQAIGVAPVAGGDGGAAFKSSVSSAISGLAAPNYERGSILDEKIKH